MTDTPKPADPDDRTPARTPTAEFRLPDVTKTREDIAVRRPEATSTRADPLPVPPEADEPSDEPEAEEPSEPAPKDATPADTDAPDETPRATEQAPGEDERDGDEPAAPETRDAPDETPEPRDEPPSADDDEPTESPQATPDRTRKSDQHPASSHNTTPPAKKRPDEAPDKPSDNTPTDPPSRTSEQRDDAASKPAEDPRSGDTTDADKQTRTSDQPPATPHDTTPPATRQRDNAPSGTQQRTAEPRDEAAGTPRADGRGGATDEGKRTRTSDQHPVAPHDTTAPATGRRDDASGGTPPRTAQPRGDAGGASGGDGREDTDRRTRASDQHPVVPHDATAPATGQRDDTPGAANAERRTRASGQHPVVPHDAAAPATGWRGAAGGGPGTGVAPTREVPLVPVALPEGRRGAEGEGLVRFVGYEPAGDVTRQDMPQVADEGGGRRAWPWVVVAVLVVVMAVVTAQLLRPVPEPELRLTIAAEHTFPGAAPVLPWPGSGQSAVFVEGLGMMGASGGARPAPTASVAKVMTAFVYLREHPLRAGEPGPTMTVSPEGVAQMPARRQRGESLLGITAGQRLTQRKALEALMIISANDVAHELAKWDSGTVQAFVAKMNAAARELGMTGTTYTDPSGYDAGTVSTAADQVKLLRAAMEIPAFAEIVNQRSYTPANGGAVREGGNFLLGQFGVVGGKTGFTDAAGGNFVFAARKDVAGVPTLIVGAVMGQETASAAGAVSAAGELVRAAEGALTSATVAAAGARVAVVDDGLGGTAPVRAAAPVTVVGWPGLTVGVEASGDPPAEAAAGAETGTLTAGAARVPLQFADAYDGPAVVDRLTRIG
ncbi:D-alanyl-D-alanine carboxypeptidase [Actinomadura cremea]|nr:D-alanyl-D-alanine carboxypeptidase [Actinomadura cremea]